LGPGDDPKSNAQRKRVQVVLNARNDEPEKKKKNVGRNKPVRGAGDDESDARDLPPVGSMSKKQKEEALIYFKLDDMSDMNDQAVVEMVANGLGAFRTSMKKSHPRYWRKYEAFVTDDTEGGLLSFFKKYQEGLCKVPNLTNEVRAAIVEKYSLADMTGNGESLDLFKANMADPSNFERNKSVYLEEMNCFDLFKSLNGELHRRMTGEFIEKLLAPLRPKKMRGPGKARSQAHVDAETLEKRRQSEARAVAEAVAEAAAGSEPEPQPEAEVRAYRGAKRGRLARARSAELQLSKIFNAAIDYVGQHSQYKLKRK
jgi:hypothetical protein